MEKRNLPFGLLKAVRLCFTFGVNAAPNHVNPGADWRLMLWLPSYGFCVAATSVFSQMKKLP